MPDNDLDQDLFIFTNSSDQEGKLYFVHESDWRQKEYEVPEGYAVSIRDIFENGALLVACPMDDPNAQPRVFYGANLFLIDKTRVKLREGGSANRPRVMTDSIRDMVREALFEERIGRSRLDLADNTLRESTAVGGNSAAQHGQEKKLDLHENDLFLLAADDDHPHPKGTTAAKLYKLPQSVYTDPKYENPPPMNMGVSSVYDMIAHGVALAAMPPGAGTLCYVISLASLSSNNQAFRRR